MYKYANKYFNKHQRDNIWRNINTVRDIEIKSNFCESHIESIKKLHPKDRIREDIIEAKMALGEFEIALIRIDKFPNLFNLSEEEIFSFREKYSNYEKELNNLDMQRISW
ncbi:hypothetical protein [Bacillus sp. 1NLA3E]|uniref:hypothetical protein n=1 Tax=Bacillus sp. 1NLA3E TaxID=666686 RepID=UPI000247EAF6|nr:hypothetical protein [Bacillus sp. 1NLA3E]AGK53173.1 hypothetical protein B1NLA3E_07045 [Bacillus sp. 1NLA3E]